MLSFKRTALALAVCTSMLIGGCAVNDQNRGGKEEVVAQSYEDFINHPPKFEAPTTDIKEVNELFTAIVKMSELQYQSLLELDQVTRNNMAGYGVYVTTKQIEAEAYKDWNEKHHPKSEEEKKGDENQKEEENVLSSFFDKIQQNLENAQNKFERVQASREAFEASLQKVKSPSEKRKMLLERQKLSHELQAAQNDLRVQIERAKTAKLNADVVRLNEELSRLQTIEDWQSYKTERDERTKFINARLSPYVKKLSSQEKQSYKEYLKARERITQQAKARQDELGNVASALTTIIKDDKLHGLKKFDKVMLGLDAANVLSIYGWSARANSWFDVFDAQLQNAQNDQGR